eukprot:1151495-Pelagomonas_calceolata.AAC.2
MCTASGEEAQALCWCNEEQDLSFLPLHFVDLCASDAWPAGVQLYGPSPGKWVGRQQLHGSPWKSCCSMHAVMYAECMQQRMQNACSNARNNVALMSQLHYACLSQWRGWLRQFFSVSRNASLTCLSYH